MESKARSIMQVEPVNDIRKLEAYIAKETNVGVI